MFGRVKFQFHCQGSILFPNGFFFSFFEFPTFQVLAQKRCWFPGGNPAERHASIAGNSRIDASSCGRWRPGLGQGLGHNAKNLRLYKSHRKRQPASSKPEVLSFGCFRCFLRRWNAGRWLIFKTSCPDTWTSSTRSTSTICRTWRRSGRATLTKWGQCRWLRRMERSASTWPIWASWAAMRWMELPRFIRILSKLACKFCTLVFVLNWKLWIFNDYV